MKRVIVMSVLAMGISGFADCAAQGDDAFLIGVGGAEGRLFLACDHELGALTATVKRVDGGVEVSVTSPDKDVMVLGGAIDVPLLSPLR